MTLTNQRCLHVRNPCLHTYSLSCFFPLCLIPHLDPEPKKAEAYDLWKKTGDAAQAAKHIGMPCAEADLLRGIAEKGADDPKSALGYVSLH